MKVFDPKVLDLLSTVDCTVRGNCGRSVYSAVWSDYGRILILPRFPQLAMLNFLGALELAPAAIYPHLLVASVDSHSKVSRRGDELVKKRAAGADLEDAALMRKLFSIFQGAQDFHSQFNLVVHR